MTTDKQVSTLQGEISVLTPAEADSIEVPFAEGFNLDALKLVDEDPFFVTVKIKAGHGDQGRGPLYDESVLQALEQQFNSKRPPGYKGHQDSGKVDWEYREPVTAWVGARYAPSSEGTGELLVKGYIPPTAEDLRKQLRLAEAGADMVNSVSIWGVREVDRASNRVTNFDLWSLDWTPKGRAGMQTELVGVSGEQAKEEDMTREEVIASLTAADVPATVADALRQEGVDSVHSEVALAGEMRVILELDAETDPDAVVEAVRGLTSKAKADELETRVDEALGAAEITAEMAHAAVKDYVLGTVSASSTDEDIAGEISAALDKPYIKALVDGTTIPTVSGGTQESDDARQGTAWV